MLTNGTFWVGVAAGLLGLWAYHKWQARNAS
jgi:hypothetical protein